MVKAFRPTSLTEALKFRKNHDVMIFNGGSDVMIKYRSGSSVAVNFPKDVLYIGHLSELKNIIEKQDEFIIGSTVTYAQILRHPTIPGYLKQPCEQIGSVAIRNIATLAGNICNASPAGDVLPSLYALNANITLTSAEGHRMIPIKDFIDGPGKIRLNRDEIVTQISFDKVSFSHVFYRKVGTRKANAISKVSVLALANIVDGNIADIRMTIGACGPTVVRIIEAEKLLCGLRIEQIDNVLDEVLSCVTERLKPIDDVRSNRIYRTKVACNLVETFLTKELTL